MNVFILCFLTGICLILFFSYKLSLLALAAFAFSLLVVSLLIRKQKLSWLALLGLILGYSYAHLYLDYLSLRQLPQAMENKTLNITGEINSLPQIHPKGASFNFNIGTINHQPIFLPVKLSWYGNLPLLKVGDQWQLQVRLKRPHGLLNPGGFDYEQYLLQNRLQATGYIIPKGNNQLLSSHWYHNPVNRLRQRIENNIQQELTANALTGIAIALSVGDQKGISTEQWQVFRNTGTAHLVAISGLHISLVAGLLFIVFNFIWRRFPRLSSQIAAPYIGAVGGLMGAVIYSAMAGFGLPTQRALIMIGVFMLSFLSKRHTLPTHSLLLALLIVLLFDPLAPLAAGFWLSFGAVALIFYGISARLSPKSLWWRWGRMQWVITLGLIPLTLILFQQASVIGLLANLIAIPWVSFVVTPLCIVGALITLISAWLASKILLLAVWLMKPLWWLLDYLSQLPGAVWYQAIPHDWTLVTVVIGTVILLLPRGIPGRWFGIIFLLPLFLTFQKPINPEDVQLTVLDVGQGLAVVVRTADHVLIYDAGPKFGDGFDAGANVVIPFLRTQRINTVNMLIVSHADNDHSGGVPAILQALKVNKIMASMPKKFSEYSYIPCEQGEHWQWDNVVFDILYPPKGKIYAGNDSSCVLKISNGKYSVLLTGDIEKKSEFELIKNQPAELPSTVLLAPHHGSKTSSTAKFVAMVAPKYAIFTTGYMNRYRLPNKTIIQRYLHQGAQIINTADQGALLFNITQQGINYQSYRAGQRQYWRY